MPVELKRAKTGIPGLDKLLNGGIPRRNVVLLSGGPGTGKTIFGQQFLYKGLLDGENAVYVALEEHPVQVRQNMALFGWDVKPFEEKGRFAIVDGFTGGIGEAAKKEKYVVRAPDDVHSLIDTLKQAIKDNIEGIVLRGRKQTLANYLLSSDYFRHWFFDQSKTVAAIRNRFTKYIEYAKCPRLERRPISKTIFW